MPINADKGYAFVPNFSYDQTETLQLSYHNATFSRLHIGDMFFRSRERGQSSNLISLKLQNVLDKTRLTVTSQYITTTSYTGQGNGTIGGIAILSEPPQRSFTLTATSETVFNNSILGNITVNRPFKNAFIALMISSGDQKFVVGDKFVLVIAGGIEIHETPTITPSETTTSTTDPLTGEVTTTTTTDPDPTVPALRMVVNVNSKQIWMPVRGIDRTDLDGEDKALTLFNSTFMNGGDGLPINGVNVSNGPDRAFAFVNYSEEETGQQTVIAKVFEWVGDDAYNGTWQIYS